MKKSHVVLLILLIALAAAGLYIQSLFPKTITYSDLCVSGDGRENIAVETHSFGSYTLRTGEVFEVFKTGKPEEPILRFDPNEFIGAAHSGRSIKYNAGSFLSLKISSITIRFNPGICLWKIRNSKSMEN